ncbi:hypothetical protein HBH70_033830 [Parastagonospora nodorum]|nr:hypothetical protein HBH51_031450 [Parastagonospora nodorum]KAH4000764.1 hypothetical protein HBI10_104200 [Parastagonospora nodorum]KAH4052159.1 hypothetical protein HBH49_112710 [Parastagonospora nodorum]KAH4085784.1 hypothetical protein HBH48_154110 [Parastagonospora nodorum]KAH4102699.1 hypothetical protein HBH46_122730 [Parastagonospora nodorum]
MAKVSLEEPGYITLVECEFFFCVPQRAHLSMLWFIRSGDDNVDEHQQLPANCGPEERTVEVLSLTCENLLSF